MPRLPRDWRRATACAILALVGLNAVAAGCAFVARPDGSALGIPQEWLADSPFEDYRVPGAVLVALGLLYLAAAVRQLQRAPDAWFWAGLSGGAMIVWIVAQAIWMGSTRHPVQTLLQALILAAGAATGLLAWSQLRSLRRLRDAPAGP